MENQNIGMVGVIFKLIGRSIVWLFATIWSLKVEILWSLAALVAFAIHPILFWVMVAVTVFLAVALIAPQLFTNVPQIGMVVDKVKDTVPFVSWGRRKMRLRAGNQLLKITNADQLIASNGGGIVRGGILGMFNAAFNTSMIGSWGISTYKNENGNDIVVLSNSQAAPSIFKAIDVDTINELLDALQVHFKALGFELVKSKGKYTAVYEFFGADSIPVDVVNGNRFLQEAGITEVDEFMNVELDSSVAGQLTFIAQDAVAGIKKADFIKKLIDNRSVIGAEFAEASSDINGAWIEVKFSGGDLNVNFNNASGSTEQDESEAWVDDIDWEEVSNGTSSQSEDTFSIDNARAEVEKVSMKDTKQEDLLASFSVGEIPIGAGRAEANRYLREVKAVDSNDATPYQLSMKHNENFLSIRLDAPISGVNNASILKSFEEYKYLFSALKVRNTDLGMGKMQIDMVLKNPLDDGSITSRDNPATLDPSTMTVEAGINEFGSPFSIKFGGAAGGIIGGIPGSGKTAGMNSFLVPMAMSEDVDIHIINGKYGDDWDAYKDVVSSYIAGTSEIERVQQVADIIGNVKKTMFDRQTSLKGLTGYSNFWNIPVEERRKHGLKFTLVVIDEAPYVFTGGEKGDREMGKLRDQIAQDVQQIILQGRSGGVFVLLSAQKPTNELIPTQIRDNSGVRISFKQISDYAVKATIGDVDFGQPNPMDIPRERQGGAVILNEKDELVDVRFYYISEQRIEEIFKTINK